jgi:hypothetical protein
MRQNQISYHLLYYLLNQKIFPKINFILGNNALETKRVKSNYFGEDLYKIKNPQHLL